MARQTLTITLDHGDVAKLEQLLQHIESGLQDMSPMWQAIEMHMIDSLIQNFESEGRPTPWEPLADWTIQAKGSSAILQDTGALKASINAQNTEMRPDSLELWAGEAHGLFHQYVEMEPSAQFGILNKNRKHPMPMRPFILFQDEDRDKIEEIASNYINDLINGG